MNIDKNKLIIRKTEIKDMEQLIRYRLDFLKETEGLYDKVTESVLVSNLRKYFRMAIPTNEFNGYFAEYNGRILATGSFTVWYKPPTFHNISGKLGYLLNMYTIPEARRNGICAEIIKKMIADAGKMGVKRLSLHAYEAGINVYKKSGFTVSQLPELVLRITEEQLE